MSISKIVNMVLLGGLVGASQITSYGWDTVHSFLEGGAIKLDNLIAKEYVSRLMALKQLT